MAEYVVFRAALYEDVNLHVVDGLGDALDIQDILSEDGSYWEIAEILPTDNWLIKLILWLHKRSK
jgi:hypothetical protein